jgi:superfamily I DNA/RNA helicase
MSWWLDISDLDQDQKRAIDLPPKGNYLLLGPPGSGKTNLLLIRAEYLIRTGLPHVFVLMFNDSLHDFVVRGGAHYDVPPQKIRKILSWELVLLRENGVNVDELQDESLVETRRKIARSVLDLLAKRPALVGHVDCLLVDEAQDCLAEEIDVFFKCAKHVCFAGDPKQRIFSTDNALEIVDGMAKTIELKTHYRIGHEICRAADAVGLAAGFEPIEPNCNYKGPESKVHFYNCSADADQFSRIEKTLKVQLTAYPGELLAVAAPRKADRDAVRAYLETTSLAKHLLPHRESGSHDADQRIYIAHVQDIKGLEFRALHLALMQHIHRLGENQKRISYTAITRAKTTLSIYFTGNLPGYLEKAQVAVEPPKVKPALADLFPKKAKK